MTPFKVILLLTTLLTGMIAGLFYGYDCSVINGLAPLPDSAYLAAFQSINTAIQHPYFFGSFMGSLLLLPVCSWMAYRHKSSSGYLLAATLLYITGVFGITVWGNVPLNNELAQLDINHASAEALHIARLRFEPHWNTLHHIRTFTSIGCFLLMIIACIKKPAIDIAGCTI